MAESVDRMGNVISNIVSVARSTFDGIIKFRPTLVVDDSGNPQAVADTPTSKGMGLNAPVSVTQTKKNRSFLFLALLALVIFFVWKKKRKRGFKLFKRKRRY